MELNVQMLKMALPYSLEALVSNVANRQTEKQTKLIDKHHRKNITTLVLYCLIE